MLSIALLLCSLTPQAPEEVLADETRELPTLGIVVRDERLIDRASGRILRRTTDLKTGERVDADQLLVAEGQLRDLLHAKLSHELRAVLAQEPGELRVVFWLARDPQQPDLRGVLDGALESGLRAEEARREALGLAETHTRRLTEPFVDSLREAGLEPAYVDPHVPIVFVDLTPEAIAPLAARAEVDQVYYSFPHSYDEAGAPATLFAAPNEWASPSARTDSVHRRGIDGAGVKVMVNDTSSMVASHPNLPPIISGNPTGTSSHATAVAGIVCSNHEVHTGAAPGLTALYQYGAYGDDGAPQAWSWAMGQGVSFGNCSWWNGNKGSIVFLDRYFDHIIRNFGVMMFKSCGNQGNGDYTTTPGNGFNTTATGNADDRNTHDWDDDIMASGSSTANPQPSDHEKPEVAAHGTDIYTTTPSGGVGSSGSGTSFASPVTCGIAALMAQTDPVLEARPEAVKALLMAGAWNNIHGAAPLSDYDGAGGVDAAASHAAVEGGQYVSTTLTAASFSGGVWSHAIHLDAFDETRIAGLWFSLADAAATSDVLEMDLDMTVEDPGGNVVASSASTKNPFEILSFVPYQTGTYTVKLHQMRFLGANEPFALAWTTSLDYATNEVSLLGSTQIGQTLILRWSDCYHPFASFIGMLSATPYPATLSLPDNKLLPIGVDAILGLSLATPGFAGSFDANGRAMVSVPIPNQSGLVGTQLHAALVTLESGQPLVEETSRAFGFTITP